MSRRNTTEVANSVQNSPSEMASLGMSWMSSTAVATMPLTMAAPVGMPVFGFSWAKTFGMFWFFAAYWATAFTPKDQEAMFANRVMRNTTAMMMKMGEVSPTMVITA